MITVLVLFVLFTILFLWYFGVNYANDLSLPTKHIENVNKMLVIYPHPDDEVMTCGGLMHTLSKKGVHLTYHILTKGERGNEGGKLDGGLKATRTEEAKKAAAYLGVDRLIHDDFGDGQLAKRKTKIQKRIEEIMDKMRPDLVVTYEPGGLYGHEDHMVVSDIVTELAQSKEIVLLYTAMSQKMLDRIELPEHMAKSDFKKKRLYPTMKYYVGLSVFAKIRALYAYRSQLFAFKKAHVLPMWFTLLFSVYEYFHE